LGSPLLFSLHCGKLTPSDFRVYPMIPERSILMLFYSALQICRFWGTSAVLWVFLASPLGLQAKTIPEALNGVVALQQLPPEGQETYRRILKGGPFPYEKDGVVFGNRERILPQQARGYYHEYTVKTPGERTRGARRIVCGGLEVQKPANCYYSDDHYTTFREIADSK
jgi:ribonuclease T1